MHEAEATPLRRWPEREQTMRTAPAQSGTAYAVSPDSDLHWTTGGAWYVGRGVYRIPLPLPLDALKAVNVYVIETLEGLVLIDGGWAIIEARELLHRSLASIGYGFGDIRRFLVTHAHRDHFTLATVLGREFGADVALGLGEKPTLELLTDAQAMETNPFAAILRTAGANDVAAEWTATGEHGDIPNPVHWQAPTTWLDGDQELVLDRNRSVRAVHTPGHTPGHYVFADLDAHFLFTGDHILPTITPSVGFVAPPTQLPLSDFLRSLAKVRGMPDLAVLPAHGPIGPSTHQRADELLAHHEMRLHLSQSALREGGCTAEQVARRLPWTRHQRPYEALDVLNQGMAAMETLAHLEVLVARGHATAVDTEDGVLFRVVPDRSDRIAPRNVRVR
jgi:glyoxylase-like metal-dependent hydrolase (beta-lactamase superfamily II)